MRGPWQSGEREGHTVSDEGRLIAGRYRLAVQIGRGGMGTVWRAQDELLDRQVALKQLHISPHLTEDEVSTLFERTRREARSAARIAHPNVVVVHDVVEDSGLPCIVMEYVPSTTLGDLLKGGRTISPDETARIGRGMIAALRAAHAAGVLHRDVKPGNVLLGDDGRVVLTDFGIAMATGTSTLTKTGEVVGSIDFIAPERIRGRTPGPASDLWALGATLYQAVEGRPPFRKATPIETGYAIAVDPLEPPLRAGPLTGLIEALLAKEPEDRPNGEQIDRALRGPAGLPETTSMPRPDPEALTTQLPAATPAPTPTVDPAPTHTPTPTPTPGYGHTPTPTPGYGHTPTPGYGHTPTPTPTPGYGHTHVNSYPPAPPPHGGRRSRKAVWTASVAAVAVVGVAAGVYLSGVDLGGGKDDGGRPGSSDSATSASASPTYKIPPLPDGYHRVELTEFGVSLPVPDDWTRQPDNSSQGTVDGTQEVRFLDASQKARLMVNVIDPAGPDPVKHFEGLETQLKQEYPAFERMRLSETKYRGLPGAIWEFKFQGRERWYRAIDLGFGEEGGKAYALYLSAPADEWETYLPVFQNVKEGFKIEESSS
ncbi:serine/threonine-protein kinase [Streptomyces sp. NPDC059590]|uniref:serine/threonine-protein kinase n=1 Tax=Streptomyces sp. NPDC059590 TaxID=3346877 RepID=UPI00367AF223